MIVGNANVEWSDEILILVDELVKKSTEGDLSREGQALIDVVETVQLIEEGDGLHDFWQSGLAHNRIINSFDLIDASGMVDVINASQWCQTRSDDRGQYSETELSYLAGIEEEMQEAMNDLSEQVDDFVAEELTE